MRVVPAQAVAVESDVDPIGPPYRPLNGFTASLLAAYLAFILSVMLISRASITPEIFLVFAVGIAGILGRTIRFVRDWLPFIGLLVAWQAMRGVGPLFGADVQSDSVIAIERFIFFGLVPSEALQALLHQRGEVNSLDAWMSLTYLMHFTGTLIIAFLLWVSDQPRFRRFALAILVLSIAQFVTAVLLPVAPPRFAFQYGEALAVTDIGRDVGNALGFQTFTWAYNHMNANPVAAFPSLHAAYPVLAWLTIRTRWPRVGWCLAIYTATVWFAIVYLGHHYVVDIIGGVVYAVAALGLVTWMVAAVPPATTTQQQPNHIPARVWYWTRNTVRAMANRSRMA